ncbi:MAG: VOC family protein [Chitinophagia bacterium]|jgi:uncharacterized glyoxalase superfamily protein PhnB|nr:VOC family protein [Chitinophagia bacterium]
MNQQLGQISLLVKEYDEAIEYYTNILGFELIEDTKLSDAKRWVVIKPRGSGAGCQILLAKASTSEQINCIGNQTGGRVFLFLYTDDFMRDYNNYTSRGVEFIRPIQHEPYGTVSVFKDIYGNLWDLIGPNASINP